MTVYAYVRVSTLEQNLDRQIKSMLDEGVARENIFCDKQSGKNLDRPKWHELLDKVQEGDEIILDSLDRLGRNYADVTCVWRELTRERGVNMRVLDLPFFSSIGFKNMGEVGVCVEDMLLSLLAYVAESERKKLLRRQAEGIAIAKAQGKYKGSKPMELDADKVEEAREMLAHGVSKRKVSAFLGVHPNTLLNMRKDGRI